MRDLGTVVFNNAVIEYEEEGTDVGFGDCFSDGVSGNLFFVYSGVA